MTFNRKLALELLRKGARSQTATFREGQLEAIKYVVEGNGRLLVVQKTGWGKSFVYFIATIQLRSEGMGPALLISPLLSLMRNQIEAAERMGVRAATINSDNPREWPNIEAAMARNEVDILLISPERLANARFQSEVLQKVAAKISLLVIDEAHCISDWGHDFRPQYRLLERTVRNLPQNMRVLATTATANQRVMQDLVKVLGPNIETMRGDLNRPSLHLQTIRLRDKAERLAWLAEQIPLISGNGIIYTLTVRDAEQVASWLKSRNIKVDAYTGVTENDHRIKLEQALLNNKVKALVATTALGMGFDKPDLAFVFHYQSPGSVVAYYQQVGRAGRALQSAYGVLLSGGEETEITDFFIESAFPSPEEVESVINALVAAPDGLSTSEMLASINIGKGQLERGLDLLSLESPAPIVKDGSKWQLTAAKLSEAFWQRAKRLTTTRRNEQLQMQEYVQLESGHMEFLIRALDGDASRLEVPKLPPLKTNVTKNVVQDALEFLRQSSLPIEPRKKWPDGGMPHYNVRGAIDAELRADPGMALCYWQNAGWGKLIQNDKYKADRFSDKLIDACVTMFQHWNPQPVPTWVTCIPSLRHPHHVPDFAKRLAKAIGLPFYLTLEKTIDTAEQKTMANSAQQARNVDGSFKIVRENIQRGPVLLIDDMANSRWTFTVAAWLLRMNGSGEVFPLALATT